VVMSGVVEVRAALAAAQERLGLNGKRTVLFSDEIHRFNKAQQDVLLPHAASRGAREIARVW
jgi:putative ATPase